jgi:hypothetical protein
MRLQIYAGKERWKPDRAARSPGARLKKKEPAELFGERF